MAMKQAIIYDQPAEIRYLRMPQPGRQERTTGLKHGYLYRVAREGKIRTVTLKEKGAKRGVTLIEAKSLYRYLDSQLEAQSGNSGEG